MQVPKKVNFQHNQWLKHWYTGYPFPKNKHTAQGHAQKEPCITKN
jgi:hypothetical protein